MEREGRRLSPGSGVEGATRVQPLFCARAGLVAGRCQPEDRHRGAQMRGSKPGLRTEATRRGPTTVSSTCGHGLERSTSDDVDTRGGLGVLS